jgi:hypothetical protein
LDNQAAAWASRAAELACYTMTRLVNRVDAYGCFRPLHRRQPGPMGNIWTMPAVKDRGKRFLGEVILTRHFVGLNVGDLIGLHSTSPDNRSRWGALDIDWHGDSSTDPQLNWEAAKHWFGKARGLGCRPLLEDSNGCGGFHLWLLFREPVSTLRVYAFLHWLTRDFVELGLSAPPEQFPKQQRIEQGKYGNWLRLFGRHHSKDHWSRFWVGQEWLAGNQAIEFVLATEGVSPTCIPAEAEPVERSHEYVPVRSGQRRQRENSGDQLARRISARLARLPSGLGVGQHRHDVAFKLAAWLVRDLQLSDSAALTWLTQWDQGNATPLGKAELEKELDCAHRYGTHAYGSGNREEQLPAGVHGVIRFEVRG